MHPLFYTLWMRRQRFRRMSLRRMLAMPARSREQERRVSSPGATKSVLAVVRYLMLAQWWIFPRSLSSLGSLTCYYNGRLRSWEQHVWADERDCRVNANDDACRSIEKRLVAFQTFGLPQAMI
ncbi:hypothetical protein EJ03DRAFT_83016 [Teratosphaeria nubilosa]|uniref:Uncharacterized protein n=1 Tax=Teratosphaeria nubilosa TaxID=161662 RepID=A0A6G1LAW0_9PEZI|nr:hypothetical protein EJ03DRAFT_83016 [Teratosphaeria nubilosa]